MIVNPEKSLHPTMNVAFDDDVAWTFYRLNTLGLVRTQGQVYVEKSVQVDRMKDGVTVDGFNAAPGCQYRNMRLKLAVAVVQDEGGRVGDGSPLAKAHPLGQE